MRFLALLLLLTLPASAQQVPPRSIEGAGTYQLMHQYDTASPAVIQQGIKDVTMRLGRALAQEQSLRQQLTMLNAKLAAQHIAPVK